MPQQTTTSVLNNFSEALKTEFTGLNFPPNAVAEAQNCIFNRIGNVNRRPGIDYETNYALNTADRSGQAITSYKWNNVGGDGLTQILVVQVGGTLYFYKSTDATLTTPLSTTILVSTVVFQGAGTSAECQYSDGNGYLFVFHPNTDPIYCTYSAGTVTVNIINLKIRDFTGIAEPGVSPQDRPPALSAEHSYNLQNQGWTSAPAWTSSSTSSVAVGTGTKNFTIATGLTIVNGTAVQVNGPATVTADRNTTVPAMNGTVTSYNSGSGVIVLSITSTNYAGTYATWTLYPFNTGLVTTWHTAEGNYPSNSDVWWRFKNSSGVFDPATTQPNVTLSTGRAPKGFYILEAFNLKRSFSSGITGLTDVVSSTRPRTGTWFQGRVWYSGVDNSQAATGDAAYYTWTENIYFSQTIQDNSEFGNCYQVNDPTSETLFDLLPTDGGVITIQGSGSIYKLFPIQNGLLVFAANGVWFITGSQGVGFAANDYTVVPLSSIQTISGSSFVNVQGYPMWWNEEGIYAVVASSQNTPTYGPSRGAIGTGGLLVQPLTYTTIQTLYTDIPLSSKRYAKGIFDPINWEVKWIYKTTEEASVTDRYQFDGILVHNTVTQSFYPWLVASDTISPYINGLLYVQGPGGSTSPDPTVKYLVSKSGRFTFAEEKDLNYVDWASAGTAYNYVSYFTSGYHLAGQAIRKFQNNYVYVFLNAYSNMAYKIQGVWDYAISRNSGKFTGVQVIEVTNVSPSFGVAFRKHRVRGRGIALQFKITSVDGTPFDIIGWSVDEKVNTSI